MKTFNPAFLTPSGCVFAPNVVQHLNPTLATQRRLVECHPQPEPQPQRLSIPRRRRRLPALPTQPQPELQQQPQPQPQRSPVSRRGRRRPRLPTPQAASPNTMKQLISLLNGDTQTAARLIVGLRRRYPEQTEQWRFEKAIFDLQRDRT